QPYYRNRQVRPLRHLNGLQVNRPDMKEGGCAMGAPPTWWVLPPPDGGGGFDAARCWNEPDLRPDRIPSREHTSEGRRPGRRAPAVREASNVDEREPRPEEGGVPCPV